MSLTLKSIAIALCPILVAAVLAGCSSTMIVNRQTAWVHGDTLSVDKANRRIEGRTATITLRDSTSIAAKDVVLGVDSCEFLPVGSPLPRVLPSSAIAAVKYRDPVRGLVSGFLMGSALGAGIAVAPVLMAGGADGGLGPVLIGGAGVVMGTLAGGILGENICYRIELPPVPQETSRVDQDGGKLLAPAVDARQGIFRNTPDLSRGDTSDVPDDESPDHIRDVTIFLGMGPSQCLHFGVGVQWSEDLSVGVLLSGFLVKESETTLEPGGGIGVRGSWYLSPRGRGTFLRANVVSCDIVYLPSNGERKETFGGWGIEATIGRDCIVNWGVGLSWGVGMAASFYPGCRPMYFPAIRGGVHIDI